MCRSSAATLVLNEDERDRAKAIGAYTYINSRRFKLLRHTHFFSTLDAAVASMDALRFPNPYDGRVLGALAGVMLRHDGKALGYLRKRKVRGLDDKETRREILDLGGLLVAEKYLAEHKKELPSETRLTSASVLIDALGDLFEEMRAAGKAMEGETVIGGEVVVSFADDPEPGDIARQLIEEVIGSYESLVPEIEGDAEIPPGVQRRSLAKAAFLRLGAEDLAELSAKEGLGELPNKDALATALSEKYSSDLDEVARLVLRRLEGDPEYGLVTRLVPLRRVPDLDAAAAAFGHLRGRYLEPRTALFFIFGDVDHAGDFLCVRGRIRSFTVNPAEAGGETQLNFRPHIEDTVITLRTGSPWAEVNTRRTGDLQVARTVLRRTAAVDPSAEVARPDPLVGKPYSGWDTRTLWMLEFLRRDLAAPELLLDDTFMANFITPEGQRADHEDEDVDGGASSQRGPNLDAVRLLGRQLHDHPESCARISSGAQLRDLDIRVRVRLDARTGLSKLVRFRLSWDRDHIAVMSGGDKDNIDADLHRRIVGMVRTAAARGLDEVGMQFTLRQIEKLAVGGIEGDAQGLFPSQMATG